MIDPVDSEQILAEADRCVKCGYCLPHCPTYALSADEGESPRGRIALIQGLVTGAVDSGRLHDHLNSCLACRACEAACPSEVRYGKLITSVREIQKGGNNTVGFVNRALLQFLSQAPYLQPISSLAGMYQKFGFASFTNKLGSKSIRQLNRLMPDSIEARAWKEIYPTNEETFGRVGLFTGCISRITDRPALEASISVLNRLGYDVVVPKNQGCCGAMHLHSGDQREANLLTKQNHQAFSGLELDAIVSVASGCCSHLKENAKEGNLSATVMDISSFLCKVPDIKEIELKPLNKMVAVHTPCSMKNVLKEASAPLQLLEPIPDIKLLRLPENGLCCGAAGIYIITNPESADALREDKMAGLRNSKADILVTSNTGCTLHMTAGIREAGMEIEVLHPVELFARQISD